MPSIKEHYDRYAGIYEIVLNTPIVSNFINTRDKEVKKFLNDANGSLLDVGVGTGYYLKNYVHKFRKIVVLDISKKMLQAFKKRIGDNSKVHIKQGSINNFESRLKFDAVLCIGVFNYFDKIKTIKRLNNLIKKNGSILITFIDKENIFGIIYSLFWNLLGVKVYTITKKEVIDILRSSGFRLIKIKDKSNNSQTFHLIIKASK